MIKISISNAILVLSLFGNLVAIAIVYFVLAKIKELQVAISNDLANILERIARLEGMVKILREKTKGAYT